MKLFSGSVCLVIAWALLAPVMAQTTANPKEAPAVYRNTVWEDLTPKDWDPMKDFKDTRMSMLSDADPRAAAMLKSLRAAWDNAPTNDAMEGATVRIPGYLVPLEETKAGMKEFLLVPYFGACIHTPPPPSNQIIHVLPKVPAKGLRSMDAVWVSGTLRQVRSDTSMGASGYRMDAVLVEPYTR
jgi:uncharacterized protein